MVRRIVSNRFLLVLSLVAGAVVSGSRGEEKAEKPSSPSGELVEVRKIWDDAPHNAFTDLIRFDGKWFCAFREGKAHVSPDGALRIIESTDGETWTSAARIESKDSDLRDAKLSITPDGKLMLMGAGALHDQSKQTHHSLAWFSDDGRTWSDAVEIGDPNFWLWRATWHGGKAYGIGYFVAKQGRAARLYESADGKTYSPLVEDLYEAGEPNESSIVFDGDTAHCLLRREAGNGLLGTANPPYREWIWQDLGKRIGGPQMIRLADGRFLAGVRLYDGKVRTSLCWVKPTTGSFEEFLTLPSGGDTSYAGLVPHEGLLWVSYYSSHEGKASIYLAKVRLPEK